MENFPQLKHPPMFEVIGSTIPSHEVNRRLKLFFDALPRLWTDYAYAVSHYRNEMTISADELRTILTKLSLRPEQFLEWDTADFDEWLDENIKIARERGSHDEYK